MTGTGRSDCGMVHGRFQPFHLGHLACTLAAARLCDQLFIGITNPDRRSLALEPTERHRHLAHANPFSYTERLLMIRAALSDEGIEDRANVIPFPIDQPALWEDYVPGGAVHYLRAFTSWGHEKVSRLRGHGYRVCLLESQDSIAITGTEIRREMRDGGSRWRSLVPAGTARVIRRLKANDPDEAFGNSNQTNGGERVLGSCQ